MRLCERPSWLAFEKAINTTDSDANAMRLIQAAGLSVDLSTQRDSPALRQASESLLMDLDFAQKRQALFDGQPVNTTENRAALHTALRAAQAPASVKQSISDERARLKDFVDQVNTHNRYQNVLHLGIGGSDWGPRMVWQALRGIGTRRTVRFAANIDAHAITAALDGLDPADTLILIASKSFTTVESMTNARHALAWMQAAGVPDPLSHVVALTANPAAARAFGIAPERIFPFWDWVGGRYSVWSSIGLPIALGLGWKTFESLLGGAAAMDDHFLSSPIETNAPIQMALNCVANTSVLGYRSEVICPYDARLAELVPWSQQLQMESLGKSVDQDGELLSVNISPAVWGMPGTDSQHTFFQWLHQGQSGAPVEFILCLQPDHANPEHHQQLVINCLAQRAALWRGRTAEASEEALSQAGYEPHQAHTLAKHCVHPGARPSTLIVLPSLDAHRLGALLALYEHKVFTAAVIWGINPFDQWGVEFGKSLARQLLSHEEGQVNKFDASTQHWLAQFRQSNRQ